MQLQPKQVLLGQTALSINPLEHLQKKHLHQRLQALSVELLEDSETILVEQIENIIISHIHFAEGTTQQNNWSYILTSHFHKDYSYLSKLFSETEGMTIEQYVTRQKKERLKELLQNKQSTLSQIVFDMQYSSTA